MITPQEKASIDNADNQIITKLLRDVGLTHRYVSPVKNDDSYKVHEIIKQKKVLGILTYTDVIGEIYGRDHDDMVIIVYNEDFKKDLEKTASKLEELLDPPVSIVLQEFY